MKLETLTNVAIITFAAVAGVVLVKNNFIPSSPAPPPAIQAGDRISVEGIDWSSRKATVVLALQARCRYCTESAPFYRHLLRELDLKAVQVAAIFPHVVSEGHEYLKSIDVALDDVRRGDFRQLKIPATPSVISLDRNGVVRNAWIGKLSAEQEKELLAAVTRLSSSNP